MSDAKRSARAQQAKGAVKEAVGRLMGNERMTADGRSARARGELREAAHKIRDAFRR
ncbi:MULTISPECIES: CsbD family protein [unclassified Streptomyces]|uniref:CsbD family protein n=1 Tax=unclassified Streptomyces TaxID=2593676 RepID=UPI0021CA6D1C|nr:CsbD family protein [Streptomyces sp. FIT100]